jgi:hypothetical protein
MVGNSEGTKIKACRLIRHRGDAHESSARNCTQLLLHPNCVKSFLFTAGIPGCLPQCLLRDGGGREVQPEVVGFQCSSFGRSTRWVPKIEACVCGRPSAHLVTDVGGRSRFRTFSPPPWTGANRTLVYSRNAVDAARTGEPCRGVPPNSSRQMLKTCGSLRKLKSAADSCLA